MQWWALQQIKSRSPKTRLQAVQSLRELDNARAMEAVCACLNDPDTEVAIAAAQAVGKWRQASHSSALLTAIRDPRPEVRKAIALAIRSCGDASAPESLAPLLEDPDVGVRGQIAHTLRSMGWTTEEPKLRAVFLVSLGDLEAAAVIGSVAIPPLLHLLKNGVYHQRIKVIELLGSLEDSSIVKPLMDALKDSDPIVQSAAADALGRIGDGRCVEPMIRLLNSPVTALKRSIAGALGRLCDERAASPLARLLDDPNWEVRSEAAQSLSKMRDCSVEESLIRKLNDKDTEVRQTIVGLLGRRGTASSIEHLIGALTDEHANIRTTAEKALQQIDPLWHRTEAAQRAMPFLREQLRHHEYWVRQSAANVLTALGDTPKQVGADENLIAFASGAGNKRHAASEILSLMLNDRDAELRQAAAEALGRIGEDSAGEALAECLTDPCRWVKLAAANSLQRLNWEPQSRSALARQLILIGQWERIAEFGDAAIDPLVEMLDSPDTREKLSAINVLKTLASPHAADALTKLLDDHSAAIRQAAAEALQASGWESDDASQAARHAIELRDWAQTLQAGAAAIPPLLNLLHSKQVTRDVLETAEQVLVKLGAAESLHTLLDHAADPEVSRATIGAISHILRCEAEQIPDDDLYRLCHLNDPRHHVYEFGESGEVGRRSGSETINCAALRERSLELLRTRGIEVMQPRTATA